MLASMAETNSKYPTNLNPFGDDEEESAVESKDAQNDYPDHLDPFETESTPEDYDNSLNPFGCDETVEINGELKPTPALSNLTNEFELEDGNPFVEDIKQDKHIDNEPLQSISSESINPKSMSTSNQQQSLDSLEPPKPLPRTKSLLKKEAIKKRLREQATSGLCQQTTSPHSSQHPITSSSGEINSTTDNLPELTDLGSFQKRKNKRIAPPVPINFKRQVSGSLKEIEEELNGIGDKLEIIDKESDICHTTLKTPNESGDVDLKTTRLKLVELIKRRNSIVRRQKELMYRKRELKLDQLHSDIEYELRMIGNKQLSTRTPEDDSREKELLERLVEIVEEKNDIVENLNKDTSCDNHDIEETFRRLNIVEHLDVVLDKKDSNEPAKFVKREICDKSNLAKLSKIATLLPKANTIKMKRKHLFKKKGESQKLERVGISKET